MKNERFDLKKMLEEVNSSKLAESGTEDNKSVSQSDINELINARKKARRREKPTEAD